MTYEYEKPDWTPDDMPGREPPFTCIDVREHRHTQQTEPLPVWPSLVLAGLTLALFFSLVL